MSTPICKRCNGTRVVDDGAIYGSGGVEFENGPVRCVKDCPDCAAAPSQAVAQMNPWQAAVDDAMVTCMLDCTHEGSVPAECIKQLIDWHVAFATDPAVNGGYVLVKAVAQPPAAQADSELAQFCALKDRDAITVNLMRFGSFDKHQARAVADAMLGTQAQASAEPPPLYVKLEDCKLLKTAQDFLDAIDAQQEAPAALSDEREVLKQVLDVLDGKTTSWSSEKAAASLRALIDGGKA